MSEVLTKEELVAFRIERDCLRTNAGNAHIVGALQRELNMHGPGEAVTLMRSMREKVGRIIEQGYQEANTHGGLFLDRR